jgi:hypothetical protein
MTTHPLNARFAPMDAHFADCEAGKAALGEYIGARERGLDHDAATLCASNSLQRAGFNVNARGGVAVDTDEDEA